MGNAQAGSVGQCAGCCESRTDVDGMQTTVVLAKPPPKEAENLYGVGLVFRTTRDGKMVVSSFVKDSSAYECGLVRDGGVYKCACRTRPPSRPRTTLSDVRFFQPLQHCICPRSSPSTPGVCLSIQPPRHVDTSHLHAHTHRIFSLPVRRQRNKRDHACILNPRHTRACPCTHARIHTHSCTQQKRYSLCGARPKRRHSSDGCHSSFTAWCKG